MTRPRILRNSNIHRTTGQGDPETIHSPKAQVPLQPAISIDGFNAAAWLGLHYKQELSLHYKHELEQHLPRQAPSDPAGA